MGASLLLSAAMGLFALDKIYPLDLSRYQQTSTVIVDAQEAVQHVFLTTDEKWRLPISLESVDPHYLAILLEREDRFFHYHLGINPLSCLRAAYQWLKSGHIVSGASTLTMQTARLLMPHRRNWAGKLSECLRAFQLEWHCSKKEILKIYMTLAPMGGNIEGIYAACLAYFKKPPTRLTTQQINLLVNLAQSPARYRPKQGTLPQMIPHLARRLKQQYPLTSVLKVGLDFSLQQQIASWLKKQAPVLPAGVNVAILIVDHRENRPLVYIGSQDFFDEPRHGQVDYIMSYRSPGSTLKPFIYGMAFDRGLIQPQSLLLDGRQRFGAYRPRNFDRDTHGWIQAQHALALSLNLPVVSLLNTLGPIRFLGLLKENGITPKLPSGDRPSLAIALGGLGMNLEQLVKLYVGLAHAGKTRALSYVYPAKDNQDASVLFGSHAAQQVTNSLRQENPIAIKTGTSYGHRDALAIGYDSRYVVGVWVGLPNGLPVGQATGTSLALPILEQLFKRLGVEEVVSAIPVSFLKSTIKERVILEEDFAITFPVNKTVIDINSRTLPLSVRGGKKPYVWLVNNTILAKSVWQQKIEWHPESPGYYQITVIDANGQAQQAGFTLQGIDDIEKQRSNIY